MRGDVLAVAVAGRAEIGTWLRVRGPAGASGGPALADWGGPMARGLPRSLEWLVALAPPG